MLRPCMHWGHKNDLDYFPEMYSSELRSGVCKGGGASPEIVRQTVATALVEGHNLMGEYMYPQPPQNKNPKNNNKKPPKLPQPTCRKLVWKACVR